MEQNKRSSGTLETLPPFMPTRVDALRLTPGGKLAVTLKRSTDEGRLQTWNVASRRLVSSEMDFGTAMAVGRAVVFSASETGVRAFSLEADGRLRTGHNFVFDGPLFTKMGEALAAETYNDGVLVTHRGGRLSLTVPQLGCLSGLTDTGLPDPVVIARDPDAKRIAVIDAGGSAVIYETEKRQPWPGDHRPCSGVTQFQELRRFRIPSAQTIVSSGDLLGDDLVVANFDSNVVHISLKGGVRSLVPLGKRGMFVRLTGRRGLPLMTERGYSAWHRSTTQTPSPSGYPVALDPESGIGAAMDTGITFFRPGTGIQTVPPRWSGFDPTRLLWNSNRLLASSDATGNSGVFAWNLDTLDAEFTPWSIKEAEARHQSLNPRRTVVRTSVGELEIEFSPDGRLIAKRDGEELYGKAISRWDRGSVVRASPDGELLAVANTRPLSGHWNESIGVIQIFEASSGVPQIELAPTWGKITALIFTQDKRSLIGGTQRGHICVWDLSTGQIIEEYSAHEAVVHDLLEIPERGIWASLGGDGVINLWSSLALAELPRAPGIHGIYQDAVVPARPAKLVARLFATPRGGAMAATGDGYYKSSRGNLRGLRLESASGAFEFEQFDRDLNRPDILAHRLGASGAIVQLYRDVRHKRFERGRLPHYFGTMDNHPTLKLEGLPLAFTLERQQTIEVSSCVTRKTEDETALSNTHRKENRTLERFFLRLNSVPITPPGGRPMNGECADFEFPLTLGRGQNRIEAYVTDSAGTPSPMVSRVVDLGDVTRRPELFVLAVGVSNYESSRLKLRYAAKDASDVASLLRASRKFGKVHTRVLRDHDVKKETVLSAREFLEHATEDDIVLLFFAGHGFLDDNLVYYFATADISPDNPTKRGLRYDEIKSLLVGLDSRNRIVMLDTCFAGEADLTLTTSVLPTESGSAAKKGTLRGLTKGSLVGRDKRFALMQELFVDQPDESGAIIVASAGAGEVAIETATRQNGVFTSALLESLGNISLDDDGDYDVELSRVLQNIQTRVTELTGGEQRPTLRAENLDFDPILF